MKNFEMKDSMEMVQQTQLAQRMEGVKMSWSVMLQYLLVAVLIFTMMIAQARICFASDSGYSISLVSAIDPVTNNTKLSVGRSRQLTAHVEKTPSGDPVTDCLVLLSTNKGNLSSSYIYTDSNGNAYVTFYGQWYPAGDATIMAEATLEGTNYSDSVTISVVAPTGENVSFIGWNNEFGSWKAQLLPTDVNFEGLAVAEYDGGIVGLGDTCWQDGDYETYGLTPYQQVTSIGKAWFAGTGNWWQPDTVGYNGSAINTYRNQNRPPCGTTYTQNMGYLDTQNDAFPYTSHTLFAGVGYITVSSGKGGASESQDWP